MKLLTSSSVSFTMKNVLIAGGSGLIGTEISNYLKTKGYGIKILSRKPTDKTKGIYHWDIATKTIDLTAFVDTVYVINLTGSSIIGGRWTTKRKKELRDSRILSTKFLVDSINENEVPIQHFIQGSAMGYYGDSGDTLLTEESPSGIDFMAQLCVDWEKASDHLEQGKKSTLRIALYLSKTGGVYATLSKLARYYVASAFGNGKMWAAYTHQEEFAQLIEGIFTNTVPAGVYNPVGTEPFQMNDFVSKIAQNEGAMAFLPNVPGFMLKLILGEASATLLNSYRVTSPKLKRLSMHKYINLKEALKAL
jgi:hypothetical protein|tara:strand:+ start:29320 stop:30240 length:921 start_codon:yes stop_codon:yes gene_type:complete